VSKKKDKHNIYIEIGDGVPIDRVLRRFKRMCDNYGIVKEYRKREAYTKPSIRLKEKQEAAEKRRKKALSKFKRGSKKI
jgi:small subunit ribosomal protein S21